MGSKYFTLQTNSKPTEHWENGQISLYQKSPSFSTLEATFHLKSSENVSAYNVFLNQQYDALAGQTEKHKFSDVPRQIFFARTIDINELFLRFIIPCRHYT